MTFYEKLELEQEKAMKKALSIPESNIDLKNFYINAAIGFKRKRERLTIEEAERNV